RSALDPQQSRARTGTEERLGIVRRNADPRPCTLLVGLAPHELCNRLAWGPDRIPELAHDVEPAPVIGLAIGEADAVDPAVALGPRLVFLGLEHAPLDLGQERVDRIERSLELHSPRLPLGQERMVGTQPIERLLQLHEAPERHRIPVLGRRNSLELPERGFELALLVEKVAEVDPRLVEVRVELQCATQLPTRGAHPSEAVERVAERDRKSTRLN